MLVKRGASGHYFHDATIPGLLYKLDNYQVLDLPHKITTAGRGYLDGVAQGLLSGIVVEGIGVRRSVQLSCSVVSGLRCNLFSIKQAARNGVVAIVDLDGQRREAPLDARTSSFAPRQTDRGSRRREVEHRRERDRGPVGGVTGGGNDEGGPLEHEYRKGQRRDEVRLKFDSVHSV